MFHRSVKQLKRKVIVGLTLSSAVTFGLLGSCFENERRVEKLMSSQTAPSAPVQVADGGAATTGSSIG